MEKRKKYWLRGGIIMAVYFTLCWAFILPGDESGMGAILVAVLNPWFFLFDASYPPQFIEWITEDEIWQLLIFGVLLNFAIGVFLGFLYDYKNLPKRFWLICASVLLVLLMNTLFPYKLSSVCFRDCPESQKVYLLYRKDLDYRLCNFAGGKAIMDDALWVVGKSRGEDIGVSIPYAGCAPDGWEEGVSFAILKSKLLAWFNLN